MSTSRAVSLVISAAALQRGAHSGTRDEDVRAARPVYQVHHGIMLPLIVLVSVHATVRANMNDENAYFFANMKCSISELRNQ